MGKGKRTGSHKKGRWQLWRFGPLRKLTLFDWSSLRGPKKLLKRFIVLHGRNLAAKELSRFINLYIASSLLQRLFLLSLIALFYILAKELNGDVKLYVAIITLVIGFLTLARFFVGSCFYVFFCLTKGLVLSPHKALYLYTAQQIEREIEENHWSIRLILRIIAGKSGKLAAEIAHGAVYSPEITRLIRMRLLYFGLILLAYMLGYNILYYQLININFDNFYHPFTWAWHYLVASA